MIALGLESGWAVAGGLIPILGLAGLTLIIWRAVRDNPSDEEHRDDEDRRGEDEEPR